VDAAAIARRAAGGAGNLGAALETMHAKRRALVSSRSLGRLVVAALVSALWLVPRAARAEEPRSGGLEWRGTEIHPVEVLATAAAGAGALAVVYGAGPRFEPRITGGMLLDTPIRDGIRLRDPGARDAARAISDVTVISTLVLALGVDSIVVPLVRRRPGVMLRMLLVDLEAIAFNGLLTPSTYFLVARERPSRDDCKRDPGFDPLCRSGENASFWSGHTAQAFTSAGLSCAHHAYLHLLGGGAPDAIACATAVTLAATTGTLRVMGDRHYASDVVIGSLVGFGIGYGVPTLFHYYPFEHRSLLSSLNVRTYATVGVAVDGAF